MTTESRSRLNTTEHLRTRVCGFDQRPRQREVNDDNKESESVP